jgi:tRNA (mo5U34)-methyltransferase
MESETHYKEGEAMFVGAVKKAREAGDYTPEHAASLNNLAVFYQSHGKFEQADQFYKQSLSIFEKLFGMEHPSVAQSLSNRAALYRLMGAYAEAERLFQIARRAWEKHGWPEISASEVPDAKANTFPVHNNQESCLWSDAPEQNGTLRKYRRSVIELRQRVETEQVNARDSHPSSPGATDHLKEAIEKLGPWYHDVVFTRHVSSNPTNSGYPASRWRYIEPFVPSDLKGKSVLDIGCNSGYFSIQLKKRNAGRVLGIDIMPHLLAQARFCSSWFDTPIDLCELGAYDVESLGQFDIVMFVGVLYHLKHPLFALEKISAVCRETMYFQSAVRGSRDDYQPLDDYPPNEVAAFDKEAFPKLFFIEKSFNGDESNWWFATRSCLKAMLRVSGFKTIRDTPHPEIFVCHK